MEVHEESGALIVLVDLVAVQHASVHIEGSSGEDLDLVPLGDQVLGEGSGASHEGLDLIDILALLFELSLDKLKVA